MGFFGPYKFKDKRTGKEWFLHMKDTGKVKLYYFSKDQAGCLNDLPGGYEVSLNEKSGLPFLKKKQGPAPKKKDVDQPPADAPSNPPA